MRNDKHARGFTLIELIVVISIIAILAVVALPRLADLTDDAHRSSVDGTFSAFSVGVNLAHAQWIAKGKPSDVDDLPGFGLENVNLSEQGWPVGSLGDGNSTAMTVSKCIEIWASVMVEQAPTVGTSLDMDYGVTLGSTISQCQYTYQRGGALIRTIAYDSLYGTTYKNNI
jgi:MSHA pilin protein MshB